MSRRVQKIVIAVIALALIVPIGAMGISGAFRGSDGSDGSDGQQTAQPQQPTLPPADPKSQPKPSPTTPPKEPAATRQQTAEGAQATIRYMLDYYPYMMATGDVKGWQDSISPDCQVCVAFVAQAKKLHSEGGYIVGGAFDIQDESFKGGATPPKSGTATLQFTEAKQTIVVDVKRQAQEQEAISGTLQAQLEWDGTRWRVTDMSLAPKEGEQGQPGQPSQQGTAPAE